MDIAAAKTIPSQVVVEAIDPSVLKSYTKDGANGGNWFARLFPSLQELGGNCDPRANQIRCQRCQMRTRTVIVPRFLERNICKDVTQFLHASKPGLLRGVHCREEMEVRQLRSGIRHVYAKRNHAVKIGPVHTAAPHQLSIVPQRHTNRKRSCHLWNLRKIREGGPCIWATPVLEDHRLTTVIPETFDRPKKRSAGRCGIPEEDTRIVLARKLEAEVAAIERA